MAGWLAGCLADLGLGARAFGGDPAAVGRRLLLDGERVLGVGILPADFRIPDGDPALRSGGPPRQRLQGLLVAGDRAGSAPVALVNRSAARRLFGAGDPVGRRLRFNGEWREVVGVVGDHQAPSREAEPPPVVYLAAAQVPVPQAMTTVCSGSAT